MGTSYETSIRCCAPPPRSGPPSTWTANDYSCSANSSKRFVGLQRHMTVKKQFDLFPSPYNGGRKTPCRGTSGSGSRDWDKPAHAAPYG